MWFTKIKSRFKKKKPVQIREITPINQSFDEKLDRIERIVREILVNNATIEINRIRRESSRDGDRGIQTSAPY